MIDIDLYPDTQLARDRAVERRESYEDAGERPTWRDPLSCPDGCGSLDGMAATMREDFAHGQPITDGRYYRYTAYGDSPHDLYSPCPVCNKRRHIPEGYEAVDAAWIRAWLARPCQCPDCRRRRMDNAAPADGDMRRGIERMYC